MTGRTVLAIIRKDLTEVMASPAAILPITLVPVFFLVLIPIMVIQAPGLSGIPVQRFLDAGPMKLMIEHMPATVARSLQGLNAEQQMIVLLTCYALLPFFLIIPLMIATVIGASSFAGEKERRTIEGLIHTPATDLDLFLGKCLASVIPATVVAWVGFLAYGLVVNLCGWRAMHRIFFPPVHWVVFMAWMVPAVSGLGTATVVLISSKVGTFMEAQQIGAAMVVPVLALLAGQLTGTIYFSIPFIIVGGLVVWLLDALLLWFGARIFSRSTIILRL
jgi:ABC-2 type transport system permease protein